MSRARDLSRFANNQAISVGSTFNVGINSVTPNVKLDVVGVVSATEYYGDGSNLTNVGMDTSNVRAETLNVSGFSTFNSGISTFNESGLHVTGVITATSFSGITQTLTVGRRSGAETINIVGTGMTLSLRSGVGTVNF